MENQTTAGRLTREARSKSHLLLAAKIVTVLSGASLYGVFITAKTHGTVGMPGLIATAPYLVIFTLLCVRPVIRIAYAIVLILGPSAFLLCIFLVVLGLLVGISESSRSDWPLAFAMATSVFHASLLAIAANAYRHESGTRRAVWMLVMAGLMIYAIPVYMLWRSKQP